jgi:excisionase family DNA binding protein
VRAGGTSLRMVGRVSPPLPYIITFLTNNSNHGKLFSCHAFCYTGGMEDWMRTDEVAAELHVSKTVVWRQITAGRLPAERIGRDWLVKREDVERFKRLERPRGRPRKQPAA